MSQDNEYNEYNEYNDTLNNINELPPLEEELLQYDVVSPFTKKLINTTRSAEEKLKLVESNKLNKELDIEGCHKGNIVSKSDADSGKFVDETGNITDFRFADLNPIDAIDKQKARERSPYKANLQPKLVADLTGKSEKELTENDYTNVANYQFNEIFNSLSNKDYKFSPYDKSKIYEKSSVESIPFAYKIVGEDKYGRKLIEAINPNTGRQVSFDMSNNPYLNSSFDLYKSIDSNINRKRLDEYMSSMEDSKNKLKDMFDTDSRFPGEFIDMAQSTAYQSAARALQYGPDWLVDKKKWESIANAKTGKALADAWAGVKTSTRREYAAEMAKSTEDFAKGNYITGITRIATQLDRMFAESTTQMGLLIGGSVVGGPLVGAMASALDSTLEANEEYKVNNNGKSMPTDELLKTFAVNTALVIPESLFARFSISKFIPKKLANKIGLAYKSTAPLEAVKKTGGAALGEGVQEIAQDTFNEYMSQDQSNPKSLTDIATSPEMAVSGVAGALMGAGLSSVPSAVGAIRTARIDNKNNKIREDITTNNQTTTVTGSEANADLSDKINNEISNTTINYADKDAVKNEYFKLKEQANNPDISTETLENIKRKQTELLLNHIKATDDKANRDAFLEATGKSKEEAFDEIVYFSDLNAQKLYEETGKRATEARKEEVTKELLEVAKSLGISEDYAKKSFSEVQSDIRFGAKGYYTYRDKIIDIDNKLQDTSLSQEDIDKLNNDKGKLLNRLNYLYNNQVNKLEKFAEAVEKISEGNTNSVTFDYPSTKGSFTVRSTDLATNLRGATKGAFSVIEGIEGEIKDISDIISNHASKEQLTSLGIDSNIVKSISDRISNAATNIRNRSKSAAAKTITGKPKDMSKVSNKDLISKLHKVGSGKVEGKSLANLVGYLRNISTDRLEEVRQKTLNSKLSKEQKDIITKGINTVINIESTTVNETTAIEDKNSKLTKQANNTLNNITDDFINTSDTNTLLTTVNNLRKLFLNIQSLGKKDNDELLKRIVNKGKQINKKYKELVEKESNNSTQETNINDNMDSAKKNPSVITPTSLKETIVYKAINKFIKTQGKNSSNNNNNNNNGIIAYRANAAITKEANKNGIAVIGNPFNWTNKNKYGTDKRKAEQTVTELFEKWLKGDKNLIKEVGYSPINVIKDIFNNRYSNIFYYTDNSPINHALVIQDLQTFLRNNITDNVWNDSILEVIKNNFNSRFSTQKLDTKEQTIKNNPIEKESNKVEQNNTFTNHSGGAIGSDTYWGEVGNKYNIPTNHYYLGKKTPNGNIEISKEDAAEGKIKVTKAAIQMGRINPNHTIKNELLIRDWAQVKYADAVFAVTTLLQAGDKIDSTRIAKIPQGKGGTGYAIQMAINEGKPVYVYDQEKNQWFTYKNNTWVKTDTPILTKNFAGIGTRNLNENGKKAIEDVFNKTFNTLKQNSTIENVTNVSDTKKQIKKDGINIWYSSNENAELSNLAERPFTYKGKSYRSVEHAYQTLKSGSFDEIIYNKYLSAKEGSKITGTKPANTKNNYNIKLMEDLIKSSFEQNPEVLQILLNTGNKTITHIQDKGIWNKEFPRILTKIREELKINDIEEAINKDEAMSSNEATDVELKNVTTKSLLDKNSNSSVTLGSLLPIYKIEIKNEKKVKTQIRTSYFNLNQELKVDENTTSVLAKEGIDTALLPEILRIADRIKFNPYEVKGINNYFNYLLYKTSKAGIMAPNGLLSSSPHFRLLYNITQEERVINGKKVQGLNFEYNPITLFAVDLGVKELLTNTDLKSVLNPTTRMDLASTFGMDESTLSTEDISKLKNHIKKYGVPKTVLADRLGKLIIHNLGLKANLDEGTVGFYERISTGLGMYAISYAAQMGYLTESRYEANKDNFIKYSMTCIKKTTKSIVPLLDSYLGRKDENGKRNGGLRDKYKVTNNIIKTPRTTKSKLPHNMTLRHTNGLAKIPSFTKSVLEKLWNTSYEMDLELVDFIKENIDALKKRLSYLDKESIDLLTLDSQHSAKGVNLSIDDQFKYLFDYAEVQKEGNKFYFDWFVSRNGRIFMDSNTLNPQTSKSVQRFVCLPSSVYRDFDPTNQNHIDVEYFAIAQAFNSLGTKENIKKLGDTINSLSLDELLQLRNDLVNMDKNAFKNKYESKGIEGIENYGQCLNVLQHLIRKKQANGKPFKTWLAIENDSTTSGYFIRLLQFCNPRILKKFGEKVGIILASNKLPHEVIHELKKLPGFLDIYKTMALDASKKLPDTKSAFIEYYAKEVNEKGFSLDALSNTFIKMYDALPKPTQEGVVDSALRTLLKSPSMIFGYTAGENSIVSNVSLEIMEEFISTYNEIVSAGGLENYFKENKIKENSDTAKKLTAIRNTMQYLDKFSTIKGKSIIQQLKDKSSSEVLLNIQGKKVTLDRYFVTVLGPTYGKAIWDSLSESFKEYIQYNDSMNYMAVNMFAMFKSVLDKRLQDIKNSPTNIRGVLISERNKIIESLSELLPTLPLFYSDNRDEGMLLMKTGKIRTSEAQVQNPRVINGKLVQESTSANIYDFINPGKGGAVLPIHFIDGMMAMMTLSKFNGVIPVHDAFVMSALDNKSLTQSYNQFGYALNKDFNLYETMVNRFIEVVKEYDKIAKKEGLPSSKDLTLINGLNKEVLRGDKPITIDTFVKEIVKLSLENNKDRELFYNNDNPVYITNMDGIEGSGIEANVNTTTLPEIVFKEALEKWRDYSGPKEYVTDGEIKEILQEATDDVKARVNLFDKLQELSTSLGNKIENESHLNHLKDLIRRIDTKKIKDTIIEISKNRPFSSGMLDGNTVTIGFDDKVGELDSITKLSPFSDKSAAEIYAHELVHAAMRFALANGNTLKIKSLIDQILRLQLAAKKVVTWEDFMPSTYDSNLKEVYEENAKRIYDYIFNNPDIKNLKGVNEFIAYGLTNENLMNKLKQYYVPSNINSEKGSILDKLIKVGHTILNIVFGNKRISDLVSVLADVTGSTLLANKRNTLYKELDILTNKIIRANNRAASSLREQISKPIEQLFKLFADLRIKANKIVSPKLHTLFNLADMKGKTFEWLMNPNGNMFNNTLRFLNMLSLLLVSKSRRRALKESIIDITGISQQNAIMSLLRDLEEPDLQSARLELITMLTRSVEQSSKSLESITARELLDAFDKPLKEEEKIALTQSALFTDLSSLLGDHNIKYIKKVLSDNTFRTTEINKILAELQNEKYYLYYKNQAYGLARFMIYGLGNSMQNLNAENIARGLLTSHYTNNVSDKLVKNIDKLTTLYAIGFTANKSNKILANLDDKGLTNFLITHKNFVKESKEGIKTIDENGNVITTKTITDVHTIKGYTKQLFDSTYDIKIDFIHNEKDLAKEGYSLVSKLKNNNITETNDLAIYRRTFSNPNRRNGAGFILSGTHAIGSTLKDTAFNMLTGVDIKDELAQRDVWDIFKANINKEVKKFDKLMHTKDMTFKDFEKLSSDYTPIVSPTSNKAVDYRITMSTIHKQKLLNMNMNGISILSKMYASQNTKLNASIRNKALIKFLKDDVENNMIESTKRGKDTGIKYILLDKNTDNKYLRESWKVIPRELKEEIEKGDFYIREDWLQSLFGVQDISLADWSVLKKGKTKLLRRSISIAEYILKTLAYIAKRNLVLLVPGVLVNNVISNINYSIMNGANPAKVAKMQLANAKAIRTYLEDKKALNRIEFRERIGTATKEEIAMKNIYKSKLQNNIVHPLMEKGMYQSIVEDINIDDLESIGKISKFLKNSKLLNKIPNPIKWISRQLYMTEGTPIYDFMFQATQYSDFIARATEYQLQMERAPKKYKIVEKDGKRYKELTDEYIEYEEKVTIGILNAFINYDKPQSSIEQYLNDIGLFMFTKFAKRIQHVILKSSIDNPIGVLMFLLGQHYILDTEDILEQNIINKHWTALIYNPVDNFINATVPIPLQYKFGIRNTGL